MASFARRKDRNSFVLTYFLYFRKGKKRKYKYVKTEPEAR